MSSADRFAAALYRDGWSLLPRALPPTDLQALEKDLADAFARTPLCQGPFYGERTRRFGALLGRSALAERLVMHPAILAIVQAMLLPWCERIALNLTQAIEITPGALPQLPHRDQERGYAGMSMSALAESLRASKATLWRYFKSKNAVFFAVVEAEAKSMHAGINAAFARDQDLEAGLLAFCQSFLAAIEAPDAVALSRVVTAESGRTPEIARIFYKAAAAYPREQLSLFLQRHRSKLRDESIENMSAILIDLCNSHQIAVILGEKKAGAREPRKLADQYVEIFYRAFVLQTGGRGLHS